MIFYISKGSKYIFSESPIAAVVMEWEHFGSNGGKYGSMICSDEKLEDSETVFCFPSSKNAFILTLFSFFEECNYFDVTAKGKYIL